ncbi:MAG: 5-formyltetrahydrofolate cyclo-ligase [Firmicutes bacterium]|nr:5-formyltetrahydrofolate cyclo-ligase [Bacillota bacterium]
MPQEKPYAYSDKAALRRYVQECLHAADKELLKKTDEHICARLWQLTKLQQVHCVLAFAPLPQEVDIWPLLKKLLAESYCLYLPRICGPGIMEAREVKDLQELTPNHYHIKEPPVTAPVAADNTIELALIPGLAFSKDLWRLGRGGGFYDRYLCGSNAFRLGVTREIQIFPDIPHEQHDLRMQAILTEESYYK